MKQIELMQKSFHRLFTFWPLFLIYLSTILSIQFLGTIKLTGMASSVLGLVNFLLFFFSVSFSVSLPYFFDHKNVSFEDGLDTILENTKRLFFPMLFLLALLAIFILMFLFLPPFFSAKFFNPTHADIRSFASSSPLFYISALSTDFYGKMLFSSLGAIISSFFATSIMYFSLEKKGLLSSLWKAFHYGRTHLDLTACITIGSLIDSLLLLVPSVSQGSTLMLSVIRISITFLLTSYSYGYWKSHKG